MLQISKMESKKNTFGWARAEVVGALVNAVFLLALCFTILVEGLQRLATTEEIENPQLLLIVGAAGLFVNIIGLFLFGGGHGHSHGGGDHSHGGGDHSHGGGDHSHGDEEHGHSHSKSGAHGHGHGRPLSIENGSTEDRSQAVVKITDDSDTTKSENNSKHSRKNKKKQITSSSQLNMRGVFLHVLGDALGSVVVIISAVVIWKVDGNWKYKLDPLMSILIVFIITWSTIPLFKESTYILLQTVPTTIEVRELKSKLAEVDGVYGVHELHIWQLAGSRIIASAHVMCRDLTNYMTVAQKVKQFFHNHGIHSTTIQAEFPQAIMREGVSCELECPNKACNADTCCGARKTNNTAQENAYDNITYTTEIHTSVVPMTDLDDQVIERTAL